MTTAVESLHSQAQKASRNKGHFPNDEFATKLIYLTCVTLRRRQGLQSDSEIDLQLRLRKE